MGQPAALFQVLWTYYHLSPLLVWRYNQNKALELPWYFSLILTTITYFDGEQHWQSTNCRLYNHIRTVAFWLDAAPLLADLGLPFRVSALVYKLSGLINAKKAGLDDIISLVPIYGDILSGILQLYQVWLCFIFGVPRTLLGYMVGWSLNINTYCLEKCQAKWNSSFSTY